jgi:hypothetical protein
VIAAAEAIENQQWFEVGKVSRFSRVCSLS